MIQVYQIVKRWRVAPRTVVKWIQSGRLKAECGTDRETYRLSAEVLNAFHREHGLREDHMPLFETR